MTSVRAPPDAATTAAVRAAAPEPTTSTSVSRSQAGVFMPQVRGLEASAGRGEDATARARSGARDAAIERRALARRAPQLGGEGLDARRVELLAVEAAGRARDRLVHERAAQV